MSLYNQLLGINPVADVMKKKYRPIRDVLWAMDQSAKMLKAAGFEHRETSLTLCQAQAKLSSPSA